MLLRCVFRWHFWVNLFPHKSHGKGRSPVCVLSCLTQADFLVNTFPQNRQLEMGRSRLFSDWSLSAAPSLVKCSVANCWYGNSENIRNSGIRGLTTFGGLHVQQWMAFFINPILSHLCLSCMIYDSYTLLSEGRPPGFTVPQLQLLASSASVQQSWKSRENQ